MSKGPKKKKKVVVSTKQDATKRRKISPTVAKGRSTSSVIAAKEPLLFTRENYVLMGVGIGLMLLGYILMSGGSMPDANTWDPDIIYGFRRTVLAPVLILAGLGVEVYAIFKRTEVVEESTDQV